MLFPTKSQTRPLAKPNEVSTPTKMQTRSITAEKKRFEEEEKSHKEAMKYYFDLKTSNSRAQALKTPEERAAYTQRALDTSVSTMEQLEDWMKNPMQNVGPDTRTPDEVLHDFAVACKATSTYK
jgi:hypothetical protein